MAQVEGFQNLIIELQSGLRLEANFGFLESIQLVNQGNKLAICLHPWSWLGGRKNDP
jgi:hypothetical protein